MYDTPPSPVSAKVQIDLIPLVAVKAYYQTSDNVRAVTHSIAQA